MTFYNAHINRHLKLLCIVKEAKKQMRLLRFALKFPLDSSSNAPIIQLQLILFFLQLEIAQKQIFVRQQCSPSLIIAPVSRSLTD